MKLFPCMMCGAGSTLVASDVVTRDIVIFHWCEPMNGVSAQQREVRGCTEDIAADAYNRWGLPTQLAVVDAAWGTANNDVSVPSTDWAKCIIDRARDHVGRGDYDDINRYDP